MRARSQSPHPTFADRLLRWYDEHGRDLPWRRTRDPYAIWVSEIMLQQTQVATVIPYYHRFLRAFPTLEHLATSPLDAVLKHWEGLGYYARARHLHRAAQIMVTRHAGRLPSTLEGAQALPGLGRSTAGAILALAYGQRHPILDGNVRRVLCRYFGIQQDPRRETVETRLWRHAQRLLPEKDADLYTHAIMDLGATLCTPKSPDCPVCPVREDCVACRKAIQTRLPTRSPRKPIPHFNHVAVAILQPGKAGKAATVLIRRRPERGLWGGLWELPAARVDPEEGDFARAARLMLRNDLACRVTHLRPLCVIQHAFTHFKMTLHVFVGRHGGKGEIPGLQAAPWVMLGRYPFPSAHRKIMPHLRAVMD